MKQSFNFHFYSRIVIIAIFLLVAYFFQRSIQTKADLGTSEEIHGWAWSELAGWVSLNCLNDYDGDGILDDRCGVNSASNYRLTKNDSEEITGCAWAGNSTFGSSTSTLGWICFDNTGGANGQSPQVVLDSDLLYSLNGTQYASLVEFEDAGYPANAWQLGFPTRATTTRALLDNCNPGVNCPPIHGCFNCYVEEIKNCVNDDSGAIGISCPIGNECAEGETCTVVDTNNNCSNCLEYFYDEGGNNLEKVISGYSCTDCTIYGISNSCDMSAYRSNINSCNTCQAYYDQPGLIVNYLAGESDQLCGWAWNYDDGTNFGIGWLEFAPRITTSSNPYISVESGNIYSKGDIWSRYTPPIGRYNATYLIEAGGSIVNFVSSSTIMGNFQGELPNRSELLFPKWIQEGERYRNVLGTIDFGGLINSVGGGVNKYGSTLDVRNGASDFPELGPDEALDNKVIHFTNVAAEVKLQLPEGEEWTIPYAASLNGAGIVIIEGNLRINSNIGYEPASYNNLKDIPSIVWIVRGDVIVDPTVENIAGTFIILGDGNSCDPLVSGCGQFITGDSDKQLTVYGSVMARYFDLGRTYGVGGQPSELFINDGRLQANPPAGISDFSKVIPRFSEAPN